ncbi:hypothetical protein D1Q00_gp100 [Trichoplusia ni granulovirus LBIV-12]|uniref:Protein Diedel-like n=2 Tax=Betabaculovirus TaxID=558017 RepID=A0A1D8QLA6_GVTN|nr:hypothetical protein PsunGV_gp109 [Pseudalatia unipuncta granulovirus]YP_009506170.1 hypothetical protein D1Q00_gp100 [Trichoplusia ni granulovirus LBIV-12]ACH69459.1 unknown [Pseudalatia unipuncta granulovirus]AOW41439.1 hypothetical protein [Trichoplusia ni granulovirus LBIV-12]
MSVVKVIVLLTVCVLVTSEAKCCRKIVVAWYASNCSPYSNDRSVDNEPVLCKVKICEDGKPNRGYYCGKGDCNIFGCNCDGGCIEGYGVYNFREISGIQRAKPIIDFTDLSIW